jgi:hypothetical protein
MRNRQVDGARLWASLMELARIARLAQRCRRIEHLPRCALVFLALADLRGAFRAGSLGRGEPARIGRRSGARVLVRVPPAARS